MNNPIIDLKIQGNSSRLLVYEVLNAVSRRKGNRVRQVDFDYQEHTQRGIIKVELHEPEQVLIRRILAVSGVSKVFPITA
ncbi:hypothetical protein [Siphonobacter sp. SORGH_AS_0500]|uniref:hypothetical protein n=1 Tax=Siphonobacter sp. SORGH_AS_0500 TaxID=1864824 RepID=UPI002860BA7C|nr:hypothetical protein [Siphonobacter sp. SORGH_AS_0500]MDR6195407.1 hypothetical protein [Siphonobacter sp. SORGH_AS_0500]